MMKVRKFTVPEGGADGGASSQMTNEAGGQENRGPNGVPTTVHVVGDLPTAGVSLILKDDNDVEFFNQTVTAENSPYGLDDMECDGVDGPIYVTCSEVGLEILLYVDE